MLGGFMSDEVKMGHAQTGTIKIDVSMIPHISEEMHIIKLSPVKAPEQHIHDVLKKAAPTASRLETMEKHPDVLVARHEDKVIAYADVKNGHYEVHPLLDKLKPTVLKKEQAVKVARNHFSHENILPKDDTRFVVGSASPLHSATFELNEAKDTVTEKPDSRGVYLHSVSALRYVDNYPVFGPGSRASISIGDKETIVGLSRYWKAGHIDRKIKPSLSPEQVAAAIKEQLAPSTARGNVTVNSVELGYYDGGEDFIQPVYRFTATIHRKPAKAEERSINSHIIGYIPIEKGIEPVPDLSATPKVMPDMPKGEGVPPLPRTPAKPDDPTVGRYVVRNDSAGFVEDANNFWNGLTSNPSSAPLFTNAQYFWAYPWEYTTSKNNFVNSVNVALTEAHGDWWLFSTLKNCCDLVDINTIPGGYGASAGGNLRFWAIKACEPVPAPDDTPNWSDPWWNIFKGLHAVVGYRTIAYIYDEVGFPFGHNLAIGMSFVNSWLSAAHNSSAYASNPAAICHGGHNPGDFCTYTGPNTIFCKPMGRACAIVVRGHENDSVYNTEVLAPANSLNVYWYGD
jgi:hypothetical protein